MIKILLKLTAFLLVLFFLSQWWRVEHRVESVLIAHDLSRYYWGLAIDTVAVIQLVLAVGLAVDYAAHVGHSFMLKTGTRDERMVQVIFYFFLC